jgi:hypothetical protein
MFLASGWPTVGTASACMFWIGSALMLNSLVEVLKENEIGIKAGKF